MIRKEFVEIESFKSSTQNSTINDFIIINIPEEDVEPEPNLPLLEVIILDPDDQPMWETAKTVAPTPNSTIIQLDVDDNFVINSTHLNMIRENKFNGHLRADPHDHIREFLAICNMFRYGEMQSEAIKLLIFPFSLCDEAKTWFNELNEESIRSWEQMRKAFINKFFPPSFNNGDNSRLMEKLEALTVKIDSQIISLNEELQDISNKYNELKEGNASKNHLNDDTPMCEHHEANDIQSEGYQKQNSHDSYSHQSYHDPNDSEKSLTELNNDVKNDLEDFKGCIGSMRTIHDKLFDRDDGKTTGVLPNKMSKPINQEPQSKTDFEKLMTNFLDDQRVTSMFFKNNVNDMILKIKQNEKNFQIKIKKIERKMDEWSKSQNISSEQTNRTEPQPPPQAHTKQVNVVFTGSEKFDDHSKTKKDSPPPIITAAPRGGRTGGRTGRGGGRTREPTGRVGGQTGDQDGQGGDRGIRENGGIDKVPDFSTVIAQQLQGLLPTIIAQVGNHASNIQGDVRSVNVGNGRNCCSYKEFMMCNPKDYDGKGGAIAYTRWIKKMESVQDMSWCGVNQKVKYTTGSFIELCRNNEMQKLETEFWYHAMVEAGHAAYTNQFHELARLVPHLVTPENKRIERCIYGLAPQIRAMVAATEQTTIQSVVLKAGMLTDDAIRNGSLRKNTEKRGNGREPSRDENVRDDHKRSKIGRAFTSTTNPVRREYASVAPKCIKCSFHHNPEMPCSNFTNCNRLGHFAKDCRAGPRMVILVNARNLTTTRGAYFECGGTDHYKAACPRLNQAPRQGGNRKIKLWLLREVKVMETMEIRHVEEHS
ncbi:reverse transcriptase domain-containing protein [Tanacetum coccineum]